MESVGKINPVIICDGIKRVREILRVALCVGVFFIPQPSSSSASVERQDRSSLFRDGTRAQAVVLSTALMELPGNTWTTLDTLSTRIDSEPVQLMDLKAKIEVVEDSVSGGMRVLSYSISLPLTPTSRFKMMAISVAATRLPLGIVDFKGEMELYLHWRPVDATREPKVALRIGERMTPLTIVGGVIQGGLLRETETAWAMVPEHLLKEAMSSQDAEIRVDGERFPLRADVREMLRLFLETVNDDVR